MNYFLVDFENVICCGVTLQCFTGVNYLNVKKDNPGMGLTTGYEITTAAGGGQAHNNMQPYVVVYMWRRVS